MVKDSAITKGEMKKMENAITEFDNLREEENVSLLMYGLRTTVDVFSPYRRITEAYFEFRDDLLCNDTPDQRIRKTVSGLVGYDITVHKGLDKNAMAFPAVLIFSLVALLVGGTISEATTTTARHAKGFAGGVLTFLLLLAGYIFLL
ncbi:hypothetical protein COU12_02515 [Candidatus Jorgensenbacteria bacterium CG10_big_fil_rev_8_21_14_0_10_54_38]|uniref:Uncharacterized protein n=2 Tax=Candidatus Joergenseniibacteriota TaxID=1752739 RepID=A0A2M6WFK1_9BACT|nr:MAG: hypothetical protein COX26_01760 [Candidatus Jorgensenbacteria bacterium CG23_combo_of_CG06-09_8_20_14_all_54_14]PIT91543.1 MAG: hypothetical protein COU12_02515 [Candidatus Jorgensenbacteria bacterium CG10_big_fil_rev_8_21_14_0_10_54_38]